ncbi:hypothetical protein Pcinc_024771 [Petrolisthes cinctipes]|uniref:Uncharacterized protein n=1 Tax=Petrolisthes cinctipes TaxID=88211 RepID=A0AAE1F9W4_PETCI|nr:hypothetical protein Pcinc_024771 [Petrolisthes cinctipes]
MVGWLVGGVSEESRRRRPLLYRPLPLTTTTTTKLYFYLFTSSSRSDHHHNAHTATLAAAPHWPSVRHLTTSTSTNTTPTPTPPPVTSRLTPLPPLPGSPYTYHYDHHYHHTLTVHFSSFTINSIPLNPSQFSPGAFTQILSTDVFHFISRARQPPAQTRMRRAVVGVQAPPNARLTATQPPSQPIIVKGKVALHQSQNHCLFPW